MPRSSVVPALIASAVVLSCSDSSPTISSPPTAARPSFEEEEGDVELTVPLNGLTQAQRAQFERGREVFARVFTPLTGLGPLFNADACGECHEDPESLGGVGDEVEVHASKFDPGSSPSCDLLTDIGGMVLQQRGTPELLDAFEGFTTEPVPSGAKVGLRTTNDLFGLGLLDAVPDATILSFADEFDANGDGVSGRPHFTDDGRIGRFGRKAVLATLREFNADALLNEMGVTSPLQPVENTIIGEVPIPKEVDLKPEPELSGEEFDAMDAFVHFLRPPPRATGVPGANDGRQLFQTIGCATCHVPSLRTGASPTAALANQTVEAFTDLLLHDMADPGTEPSDICVRKALPSEFRTEPLMGLRFNATFMHSGAASTIEQSIELHSGEGAGARQRFQLLKKSQQAALLAYLSSL